MIRLSTWILVTGISFSLINVIIIVMTPLLDDKGSLTVLIQSLLLVLTLVMFILGIAGFEANSIQFGIDQLLDSPWEDQSIFIYWFVWVWTLGYFTYTLHHNLVRVDYSHIDKEKVNKIFSSVILVLLLLSTLILLFLTSSKKRWFLTDVRRYNPYRLVYKVTKFSRLHKVPVNRSAFTYCEDELPSGLDLGKAKYGGPFTTEEVEDVKALFGILKVIFVTGPTFLLFTTFVSAEGYYEFHFTFNNSNSSITDTYIVSPVILESLTVFTIPIYLVLLRPFVSYYTPSMLKRIAVGIVVPTLLAMVFLVVDSLAHAENRSLQCMFSFDKDEDNPASWSKTANVVRQYYPYVYFVTFNVSYVTKYIVRVALFEFICSQSPNNMKGLLIGLSFAVEGLYDLICIILNMVFYFSWPNVTFPSCCMTYYLINVVLGLVALSLYVYVTRGYQYRMRDEPCHVHRYVEEYYSKLMEKNSN